MMAMQDQNPKMYRRLRNSGSALPSGLEYSVTSTLPYIMMDDPNPFGPFPWGRFDSFPVAPAERLRNTSSRLVTLGLKAKAK
jgi:hypothetical protein